MSFGRLLHARVVGSTGGYCESEFGRQVSVWQSRI